MKHLLLTTIAAVVLVGCGESQQSPPSPETKPVEPVAEVAQPEPPTAKAPDISIHEAAGAFVRKGNIEAVKQHLAAGTDVNAKGDVVGWTPLAWVAYEGHKEIVELLIENGADVNANDDIGGTPLYRAARKGHKEIAELLIAAGTDVNAKNSVGQTPLQFAAGYGHKEIVELLIDNGADLDVKDDDGRTPLDQAKRHPEIADLLRKHGGKTRAELWKAAGK
jgi:cytohesin